MTEEKKRIFIAINLPTKIKQDLVKYISKVKKVNSNRNFKYVKPQALHLTLLFLGYLTQGQVNQVKKVLSKTTKNKSNFSLTTNTLKGFPNLNHARVVFIECIGDLEKVLELHKNISNGIEEKDLEVDKRKWQAHLTICRVKNNEKFMEPEFKVPNLEFQVDSIDLMKSKLTPRGAEYTVLETFKLK